MCCESLFVFLVVCTDVAAFRCREIATSYDSLEPNQNHAACHGNLLAQVLARAAHRRHRRLALSLQLSTWRMLNHLDKAGSSWRVDIVLGWTSTIPKGRRLTDVGSCSAPITTGAHARDRLRSLACTETWSHWLTCSLGIATALM